MGIHHSSSSCPIPCKTISAHATHHNSFETTMFGNGLAIQFTGNVRVETILPAYDFGDLLVDFGSSLGLWLGLSFIGLFDISALVAAMAINKFTMALNHKSSKK